MFTIKFILHNGNIHIHGADYVSVLRGEDHAEITAHRRTGESYRGDIGSETLWESRQGFEGWPIVYREAFIENANGKTTEVVRLNTHGRLALA